MEYFDDLKVLGIPKKVLLTGGAGFIGLNLAEELQKNWNGVELVVLDNFSSSQLPEATDFLLSRGIRVIRDHTWNISQHFAGSLGEFDCVFHFGEYSRIATSFEDVQLVLESNLRGTVQVLELARRWGAKFIYSASSSQFGNGGRDADLSPYAWSKAKIVELLQNYQTWFGLDCEICYFFNVYGPFQIMSGPYATVIGIFERQLKEGGPLTVVTPGTQTRDFTHVSDVVRGVRLAAERGLNGRWHFRSGRQHSIVELAAMFAGDNWTMIPERKGERFTSAELPSDTKERLGWMPTRVLEDWVAEVRSGAGLVPSRAKES
jgi:UDP-glucose 4-epimerase